MGPVGSSPTGATGPFRGTVVRCIASYRTTQRGWAVLAIDALLDRRDIIVDDVIYIQGRSLNPRAAVWPRLRQRLRAYGIETPAGVPDDEPWTREQAVALLRERFRR